VSIIESKGILKQNLIAVLKYDKTISLKDDINSWTTDGEFLYAAWTGLLKISLPKDRRRYSLFRKIRVIL